jgi:hypothetical protein
MANRPSSGRGKVSGTLLVPFSSGKGYLLMLRPYAEKILAAGLSRHRGSENAGDMAG